MYASVGRRIDGLEVGSPLGLVEEACCEIFFSVSVGSAVKRGRGREARTG